MFIGHPPIDFSQSDKEESDAELDEKFQQFFSSWNGAQQPKDDSWKKLLGATEGGTVTSYESPQKARPAWMNDDEILQCMNCEDTFSVWKRRHHCRVCGKIFCSKVRLLRTSSNLQCCNKKIDLPHLEYKTPQLVCCVCLYDFPTNPQ